MADFLLKLKTSLVRREFCVIKSKSIAVWLEIGEFLSQVTMSGLPNYFLNRAKQ